MGNRSFDWSGTYSISYWRIRQEQTPGKLIYTCSKRRKSGSYLKNYDQGSRTIMGEDGLKITFSGWKSNLITMFSTPLMRFVAACLRNLWHLHLYEALLIRISPTAFSDKPVLNLTLLGAWFSPNFIR